MLVVILPSSDLQSTLWIMKVPLKYPEKSPKSANVLQGHGRSKSVRKEYFDRFSGLVDDIFQFIDESAAKYPNLPLFALG